MSAANALKLGLFSSCALAALTVAGNVAAQTAPASAADPADPATESSREIVVTGTRIKQDGMEVHSYELKERRLSKEEFLEASIEIRAKRDFHTLEILDYMNDFSDVTISTIK